MKTLFALTLFMVLCSVLAFSQNQPWENDIVLNRVVEGQPTRISPLALRAGVSTMTLLESGRVLAAFQWFPEDDDAAFDKIAVRWSDDGGTGWSPIQVANFIDLPANITRQFDPTLVALADGRVRMYFTGNPDSSQMINENTGIYSAVSDDGVNYVYEPGERFGVNDAPVIDCSVVRVEDTFHFYAPVQGQVGSTYHGVSSDGLNFTQEEIITASTDQNWLGCAVNVNGVVRFYGTTAVGSSITGIWFADSEDGFTFSAPDSVQVSGSDPGVVHLADGTKLFSTTSQFTPPSSVHHFLYY